MAYAICKYHQILYPMQFWQSDLVSIYRYWPFAAKRHWRLASEMVSSNHPCPLVGSNTWRRMCSWSPPPPPRSRQRTPDTQGCLESRALFFGDSAESTVECGHNPNKPTSFGWFVPPIKIVFLGMVCHMSHVGKSQPPSPVTYRVNGWFLKPLGGWSNWVYRVFPWVFTYQKTMGCS